jgi:hypothetical protein
VHAGAPRHLARVTGRGVLVRAAGVSIPDGCTGAELLLCAPGGAVNVRASRSGAPVLATTLSVSAIVLSLSAGACCMEPPVTLRGWLGGAC